MRYVNIVVVCAFLSAGIVNLAAPAVIRAEFEKWGYPSWLRVAIAIIELVGSILLLATRTQWVGAAILLVVILGVLISFVRFREWMKFQYPLVLFFLLIVTLIHPYTAG